MVIRGYRVRLPAIRPPAMLTRCALSSCHPRRDGVYGFKTDPVCGEALDEPVGLSVVDLPSAVSLADRLLDIRLRQMSFVKPKQGVIGPDKTLDGHRRESTCRAEPSRASEQTAALPRSPESPPIGRYSAAVCAADCAGVSNAEACRLLSHLSATNPDRLPIV
jgi:hypothetical protein